MASRHNDGPRLKGARESVRKEHSKGRKRRHHEKLKHHKLKHPAKRHTSAAKRHPAASKASPKAPASEHPAGHPAAPAAPAAPGAPVPVFGVPTTVAHMRRLLWRAGFGPTPGQAEALAGTPLEQVVYGLTRPSGEAVLTGPEPTEEKGNPLDPAGVWGQDHCWWLDRMVRSDQQLVERMTFIWHDWFASSNAQVDGQQLMLNQNNTFRENALGNFHDLFLAVTSDPAMLVFLNGNQNKKSSVNENYAREMMELFSLGADRGAYTQEDVHEMARTLTGWRSEWSNELHNHNFRYEPSYHDTGQKTVFGQTGDWDYEDAVRLCVTHPLHPSFFVTKLWGYFIATEPDPATLAALEGIYTNSEYEIRPVVEAILQHPDFYEGPELVTPPVVFNAGLLRAIGRYVDTAAWAWPGAAAGQRLFYPQNVSGWDFDAWLDTSTVKARWEIANYVTSKTYINPWPEGGSTYSPSEQPAAAVTSAMAYWGNPIISGESQQCIVSFAESCLSKYTKTGEQSPYRAIRQNALRLLIAASPDMQVS